MRRRTVPPQVLRIEALGGANYADPSETLFSRAFAPSPNGGHSQRSPMEWQSLNNMDFSRQIMRQRYGSTLLDTLTLAVGETLLGGCFFAGNVVTGTQFCEVLVGTSRIYVNVYSGTTRGTWTAVTSSAGITYTHNATPSRVSFVPADGHLFIMLDGNNPIQVYRTGTALDDHLYSDWGSGSAAVSTTVDADSNSGQKVLNVASTATPSFQVGDRVHINSGGARDEVGYIASIQAGVSITLVSNLTFTHTAVQADAVVIENRYTQALGGTVSAITGTWGLGYYIGMNLHNRLCFSKGDVALEYSGPTNPWDRFNGGAIAADGPIVACEAFTPRFGNLLGAVGVLHTLADGAALQYVSGFDPNDTIRTIAGASPTWNHKSVVSTMNWIVYPTRYGRWEATDLMRVIDVGRRLKSPDGTGPLDTPNLTASAAFLNGFAFYDFNKRQAQVYYPNEGAAVNTHAVVLDMQLGEPTAIDSQRGDTGGYNFEYGLRMLVWSLLNGSTSNPWFVHMYQTLNGPVGVMANGKLYTTETGYQDLDTLAVTHSAKSPDFTMGAPSYQKRWRRLGIRSLPLGTWTEFTDIYLDRNTQPLTQSAWQWTQLQAGLAGLGSTPSSFTLGVSLLGGGGVVQGHGWVEAISESFAFGLRNDATGQGFQLVSIDIAFQMANLQD